MAEKDYRIPNKVQEQFQSRWFGGWISNVSATWSSLMYYLSNCFHETWYLEKCFPCLSYFSIRWRKSIIRPFSIFCYNQMLFLHSSSPFKAVSNFHPEETNNNFLFVKLSRLRSPCWQSQSYLWTKLVSLEVTYVSAMRISLLLFTQYPIFLLVYCTL